MTHMRTLYEIGRLSSVMAIADNADGGWHLDCHDLWGHTLHLTGASGKPYRFKSLDAASAAAQRIGFREIQVVEH